METQFYAYLWLRKDGTPYYAGKGSGERAYWKYGRKGAKPPKDRSLILIFPRASEQEALDTEMELIRNWGRTDLGTGCLYNFTDGGDGVSGYRHTPETLVVLRKPRDKKFREKAAESAKKTRNHLGHHHSEETKAKIREARLLQQQNGNIRGPRGPWSSARRAAQEARKKVA